MHFMINIHGAEIANDYTIFTIPINEDMTPIEEILISRVSFGKFNWILRGNMEK